MEKNLEIKDLAGIEPFASQFSRMADRLIMARLRAGTRPLETLRLPLRLDCMTIVLVRRGSLKAEVNLQPYNIKANTLLVVSPGTLLQVSDIDYDRIDLYIIFVSKAFLVDINIDLNAINIRSLIEHRSPAVKLPEPEVNKLTRFFELLDLNAHDEDTVFSKNVARSLCAAIFYQLLQYNFLRISRETAPEDTNHNRRSTYVHDFMRLVHLNYMHHRSLSFYAEQLFISPKYLTVLVKEATGRSATEWINEFVIIEAKNLLRFSGKNVQQVAYALNFPNQSSFGKFFKHLTGQSPTAYQKS